MIEARAKHNPFNILLVDDHTLYREGLRSLIERWGDFCVIGDVTNGKEALDFCRVNPPDLILMDIQMSVMNGVEASQLIHCEFPEIAIIILTMAIEEEDLFEAIQHGVKGYILKDTPSRQLKNHIRAVMRGEAVLSGPAAIKVINEFKQERAGDNLGGVMPAAVSLLTESEKQIIALISQGQSNEEIAANLFISEATVKKKLSSILQKLSLDNRVQIAVFAVRAGLAD